MHDMNVKKNKDSSLMIATINITAWGTLKGLVANHMLGRYHVVAIQERKLAEHPTRGMRSTLAEAQDFLNKKAWGSHFTAAYVNNTG